MSKRIQLMLATLLMATALSGCYHNQVVVDGQYNAAKTTPDHQATYFHIIGIIGISNQVDLKQVCPSGAGVIENKTLWFPAVTVQQLAVYCK